jgi:hypothetical protein
MNLGDKQLFMQPLIGINFTRKFKTKIVNFFPSIMTEKPLATSHAVALIVKISQTLVLLIMA